MNMMKNMDPKAMASMSKAMGCTTSAEFVDGLIRSGVFFVNGAFA